MDNPDNTPLRLIADAVGISKMAVSLALRGKRGVSEATRAKVLKAAEKLGYEPDPEVSKLMARIRANRAPEMKACLALLTSGGSPKTWRDLVTERHYVEGAAERAKDHGYRLEEFWLNDPKISITTMASIIWNRGIEGVVVAPLQGKLSGLSKRALRFDFSRFAAVEISETIDEPDLNRSIHDQYTSMLKVVEELLALGYKRPGFVIEEALELRTNGKWTAAYLYAGWRRPDLTFLPPLIMKDPSLPDFKTWYDANRPDVVIGVDHMALEFLARMDVAIPREVGYASLDLDGDRPFFSGLSGIDQNSRRVGAAAIDLLVASIHRGDRGIPSHPTRVEVEGTWIAGSSTTIQKQRKSKR